MKGIALVKRACRLCGATFDAEIALSMMPNNKKINDEVAAMHQQVVGYMEEPCSNCTEHMKQGILCIGYDESKTTDFSNPYRTGTNAVLSPAYFERNCKNETLKQDILKKRMTFMDGRLLDQLLSYNKKDENGN